jgi:uncharacterized membrane protein
MLQLVLRFAHVFFGALWVGMMFFSTFFMGPAVEEAGPEGGKVMAGLMRRRIMVLMPLFAFITLISGFWLYARMGRGFMETGMGRAFAFGGAAALLAFVVGMTAARPVMMRAQKVAQSGGSPAEIQQLRARANTLGRVVSVLLLVALAAMAVARYV